MHAAGTNLLIYVYTHFCIHVCCIFIYTYIYNEYVYTCIDRYTYSYTSRETVRARVSVWYWTVGVSQWQNATSQILQILKSKPTTQSSTHNHHKSHIQEFPLSAVTLPCSSISDSCLECPLGGAHNKRSVITFFECFQNSIATQVPI